MKKKQNKKTINPVKPIKIYLNPNKKKTLGGFFSGVCQPCLPHMRRNIPY
jgi:hypothetical protein